MEKNIANDIRPTTESRKEYEAAVIMAQSSLTDMLTLVNSMMSSDFYIDLAAWANQPGFVKKLTFEQFLIRRHTRDSMTQRRATSLRIYNEVLPEALAFSKAA